jgi:hypothetical protein
MVKLAGRSVTVLLSFLLVSLAFPATSPEDFVKDKNAAPAAAPASKPATAPAPAPAAKPAAKPAKAAYVPMDTTKIHEQYLEGDFDHAIRSLEGQLKSGKAMTHAESVFVYKHLGVMYAAQKSTQDKGKHYMHQLISIEPTAKILDMYASDMIHLIFRNVQEEFEVKRAILAPEAEPVAASPAPEPAPAAPPAESKPTGGNRKTLFMAAAGAAVAVGALTLFFILSDDEPKTTVVTVTE